MDRHNFIVGRNARHRLGFKWVHAVHVPAINNQFQQEVTVIGHVRFWQSLSLSLSLLFVPYRGTRRNFYSKMTSFPFRVTWNNIILLIWKILRNLKMFPTSLEILIFVLFFDSFISFRFLSFSIISVVTMQINNTLSRWKQEGVWRAISHTTKRR